MKTLKELHKLIDDYAVSVHNGSDDISMELKLDIDTALRELIADAERQWQPIETCPQDGYFLVYEDTAIRAKLRYKGQWQHTGYPALMTIGPWNDAIVGADAERILKPLGYRLELRDGCCENPTHWMPLPSGEPDAASKG